MSFLGNSSAVLILSLSFVSAALTLRAEELAPERRKLIDSIADIDLQVELKKLANEPQLQKVLLDSLWEKWSAKDNSLSGFVHDLHLEPKLLSVKGSGDDMILGLNYSYDRAMTNRVLNERSRDPFVISLSLKAKGSVAATASKNPNNFLESGVSFSLFQARGGVEPMVAITPDFIKATTDLAKTATAIKNGSPNFRQDPRYLAAVKHFAGHVIPQALWYVAGDSTLESDQEFKQKQWTYGLRVALSVRDWRSESWVSWLNLPDYPFALLRGLTNSSEPAFKPSGHSFPSLIGGIDLVDPKDNKDRLAVDPDKSRYQRLRGEIAFKTKVAKLADMDLWLQVSYRTFSEKGSSTAIKAANLDKFEYFTARLDLGEKFFVTYARGKLPLDRIKDQVYELGYKFSL